MTSADQIVSSLRQRAATALSPQALMKEAVTLLRRERPHYDWVGVYLLDGNELVLGPFVGKPTPHTRIPLDRGICGAAASSGTTIIVDDVRSDPRYLACSLETRSEIVVPIIRDHKVLGEIDIDSVTGSLQPRGSPVARSGRGPASGLGLSLQNSGLLKASFAVGSRAAFDVSESRGDSQPPASSCLAP